MNFVQKKSLQIRTIISYPTSKLIFPRVNLYQKHLSTNYLSNSSNKPGITKDVILHTRNKKNLQKSPSFRKVGSQFGRQPQQMAMLLKQTRPEVKQCRLLTLLTPKQPVAILPNILYTSQQVVVLSTNVLGGCPFKTPSSRKE